MNFWALDHNCVVVLRTPHRFRSAHRNTLSARAHGLGQGKIPLPRRTHGSWAIWLKIREPLTYVSCFATHVPVSDDLSTLAAALQAQQTDLERRWRPGQPPLLSRGPHTK